VAVIGGASNAMGYDCMVTALSNMITNRVWHQSWMFSFSTRPQESEIPALFESEQ